MKALANAAIACFLYAVGALALLHVLRPDYPPATSFISFYAVGPYGWLMTTWFCAMSIGLVLLVIALVRSGLRSIVARLGLLLLIVAAIGLDVSAIFPSDVPGGTSTRHGDIHDWSFLVNVASLLVATILLAIGFTLDEKWRSYRLTIWILTALVPIGFAIQFLTLHKGAPYGLANRLLVVILLAWLLTTSFKARALAPAQR
jgi:uncharacterized protein DUF998